MTPEKPKRTTCEPNTFSHCMYRRRHFVSTSHMMLHAHAWLKLNCVPQTFSHSISSSAPCHTTCTAHPAFVSSLSLASTSPSFTGSGSRLITSRNANPANVAKSFLAANRDHLLTQSRSQLMKQEDKVESLDKCINELQQQAHAQRLN